MSETDAAERRLAHQFENLEQQADTDSFGMWVFLVTEIMFFGGLFATYTIYRSIYPAAFENGSHVLDVTMGAINTGVLLTSSLTMALSVRAAHLGRRRGVDLYVGLTMFLGLVFLGIKLYEYRVKFVEHVVPGLDWRPEGETLAKLLHFSAGGAPALPNTEMFFLFYFIMTLVHALHMIIGEGLLAWLLFSSRGENKFSASYFSPVEVVGLYWHFVDLIWIFLFPLLYLAGGRY